MNQSPFNVLGQKASEVTSQDLGSLAQNDLKTKIESIIGSSEIVLFMKGNAQAPQCGFSANTVKILNTFNRPFKTYDILKDPEVRQGIKDYSNWPTFPQLYIKGKLVGGNDIVTEMYESGELQEMMGDL